MTLPRPDARGVLPHVESALAVAPLCEEPFPHLVVDRLLPQDLYATLIAALPPAACFRGEHVKPNWRFTPEGVPPEAFRLWRFVADDVIAGILVPGIARRFAPHLPAVPLGHSDIRMLLRRPGYRIRPHLDPDKSFVTTLIYLARAGDPEAHGTDLYRTDQPVAGAQPRTYYPDAAEVQATPAASIPFRANTALVFANVGLHSAAIPKNAPADLERYAIQFYIGPAAAAAAIGAPSGDTADAY